MSRRGHSAARVLATFALLCATGCDAFNSGFHDAVSSLMQGVAAFFGLLGTIAAVGALRGRTSLAVLILSWPMGLMPFGLIAFLSDGFRAGAFEPLGTRLMWMLTPLVFVPLLHSARFAVDRKPNWARPAWGIAGLACVAYCGLLVRVSIHLP